MNILISGGTGFIGGYLADQLENNGHNLIILSRNPESYKKYESQNRSYVAWKSDITNLVENAEAVVNLAGENIFSRRWSKLQKQRILESRVSVTRALVSAVNKSKAKPALMISTSAVNYYGDRGDGLIDEPVKPGDGFLAKVCIQWEEEARKINSDQVRLVIPRFGLPLDKEGGIMKPMLLPFRLFLGGPLGSGRQYLPWIHLNDLYRAVRFIMENPEITGPVNISSPNPVTMSEFTGTLGQVLGRPSWLKVPAPLLRLVIGEITTAITESLRVIPRKLTEHGFEFEYPSLEEALKDILQ